jgi:outer membrane protein insertion porin family
VQETANVQEIRLEGLKEFSATQIEKDLKLRVDGPLDSASLKIDENFIRQKYKDQGYHFVEVITKVTDGLSGKIVAFVVHEGPRVTVSDVSIKGNAAYPTYHILLRIFLLFPKSEILGLMATQKHHWYSSGPLQETELNLDLERIKNLYRNEGWLDVKAFVENLDFNETRENVAVTVRVEEGIQYHIRSISITGNTIVSLGEINSKIRIKPQQAYLVDAIRKDINAIKTIYGKLGYIECDVDPRKTTTSDGLVDLIYVVSERSPFSLDLVNISGNTKTREKVIRREMLINPGDMMDFGELRTSVDRIGSTRHFSQFSPEIEPGAKPNTKNISFKVEEAQTGLANVGGGYSTNNGFGGQLQLTQTNFDISRTPRSFGDFFSGHAFAGGGQTLQLSWQPGFTTSQSRIYFSEPYLFNKPVEMSVSASSYERNWLEYNEERDSGSLTFARRFGRSWTIGAGPRMVNISITGVESTAPDVIQEMAGFSQLRSLKTFSTLDKRDSWIMPAGGYRLNAEYEVTGGGLGGDFNFTRRTLKAEQFNNILELSDWRRMTLGFETSASQVQEFGDSADIPFFERFYAGGFNSVRGFNFRTVSPKEDGVPIGGKVRTLFNTELIYPLYTDDSFDRPRDIARFLLFYDIGNAAERWDELTWDTTRTSFGFGFRFQMGMIPISLYYAWPIKREPDDDLQRLQFNLGYEF